MASSATAQPAVDEGIEAGPVPAGGEDFVKAVADQVAKLSTGDRALLRRLYLVQASSSRSSRGDGVVLGLLHGAKLASPVRPAVFDRWRLLAHCAALLSGTAGAYPHARSGRVGEALFAAGYSENRLLRLTAAHGPALADQVVRAVRRIAEAGKGPIDLWTIFHLVGPDADEAERARLRIARDYYAAKPRP